MANNRFTNFQPIRVRVSAPGELVTINTEITKSYSRVKGINISFPEAVARIGSTLGIVIAQLEIFPDNHEAKLLAYDTNIPQNLRWFLPDWKVDADGAPISVRFHDGTINSYLQAGSPGSGVVPANPLTVNYPYDAIVNLWLTNTPL